ncbi:MAG: type II CAAX endopeptidase family protein [Ginsengibacter sp.]
MIQKAETKRSLILLGVFLAAVLFIGGLFSVKIIRYFGVTGISDESSLLISRLALWLCFFILYAYVRKIEHQKFLLWQPKKTSAQFYIVSFFVIILCIFIVSIILKKVESIYGLSDNSARLKTLLHIFRNNTPLFIFTIFTAAVIEELFFRGYLMPRLQLFFKNAYLPIIISSVLFGLAHFGFNNISQMINTGCIGLITAIHFSKYRNIYILMIVHFAVDIIGVYTAH